MTEDHVKITSLLIEYGAVVDDLVVRDHDSEMVGGPPDLALCQILETARNTTE